MGPRTSVADPSPGSSTIPGAVISHSHTSPRSPTATVPYVPSSSSSLATALSSATTLAAITLPALSTVLQESPLATTTAVAGSEAKVIVVVTTTVAAHLATATATPMGPQYSRPQNWTPGFTAFVVMASVLAGCTSLVIVWFLWQTNRNKPHAGDMEGGVKSPHLPGMVAAGQRLEGGRAGGRWSILSGSELYGSEPGAGDGQGISRSATASSGGSAPRGSASDAEDRVSSSAGASSYLSAAEYKELDGKSICSTSSSSSSENDGPHSPTNTLAPLSFNPGQILINPGTTPTTAVSAINASTTESSRIWENRALGGPGCFVSSCRHPFSGEDMSPALVLEHKEAGDPGRSFTGPEKRVERRPVPRITGSLQERLLGKYPARWG